MTNYVILIDENGQPYIAHSVFTKARDAAKSAARSAHKYIARIGDRYFYTQEELKAFYNRGKAAAGKAAETVRGAATKAATTAKSAASSVSKYASDRLGDVSDFVHRRNKAKSPGTSGTTDREIDDSENSKNTLSDRLKGDDREKYDYRARFFTMGGQGYPYAPDMTDDKYWNRFLNSNTVDDAKSARRQRRPPGALEREDKTKKRLGRRKTNIVDIDPNTDVKGRMDSGNETHSTDESHRNNNNKNAEFVNIDESVNKMVPISQLRWLRNAKGRRIEDDPLGSVWYDSSPYYNYDKAASIAYDSKKKKKK